MSISATYIVDQSIQGIKTEVFRGIAEKVAEEKREKRKALARQRKWDRQNAKAIKERMRKGLDELRNNSCHAASMRWSHVSALAWGKRRMTADNRKLNQRVAELLCTEFKSRGISADTNDRRLSVALKDLLTKVVTV